MTDHTRQTMVRVFVASVGVNAVLGVWALVVGEFGDIQGKILATSFLVTAAMVAVLINVPAISRRAIWPIPTVSGAAGAASFALFTVLMWAGNDSSIALKIGFTALLVGGGGTLTGLVALLKIRRSHEVVRLAHYGATLALVATSAGVIWSSGGGDIVGRIIGVESVLVAALTLALPALGRLARTEPEGSGPDQVESERDTLLRYLNRQRDAVVRASESLTDQQQRDPGVASGTNLLGLIQHLTGVEQHWFRVVFLGEDLTVDKSMDVAAGVTRAEVVAAYRDACARSDEIVFGCSDLSELAAIVNPGEEQLDSLRTIVAHMIEETARHAGQADILRELIDGAADL